MHLIFLTLAVLHLTVLLAGVTGLAWADEESDHLDLSDTDTPNYMQRQQIRRLNGSVPLIVMMAKFSGDCYLKPM